GPAPGRLATSTPHTITTPSPAAAIPASARLRWYVLPSGAWDHHRVSRLPRFRARPASPAAAGGTGSPAAPVVIATTPAQQVCLPRAEYCAARPMAGPCDAAHTGSGIRDPPLPNPPSPFHTH